MSPLVVPVLVEGLLLGARYALFAAGFTILFGALRMPFIAYGQLVLVGAYAVLTLTSGLGVGFFVAALAGLCALLPVLYATDRVFFRPLYASESPVIVYLIITIGLTQILSNAIELVYTANPRTVFTPYRQTAAVLAGYPLSYAGVLSILITGVLVVGVAVLLAHTRFGRALRAMVQNRDAAALMGVDIIRTSTRAYLLAGVLAVAGGMLLALDSSFSPDMAVQIIGIVFVIALVGGSGSIFGAMLVGLILGFVLAAAPLVMEPYMVDFSIYGTLFAFLVLKPEGIFRR